MPKPNSLVGWCLVAGGVLLEAIEHITFINSALPRPVAAAINEPVIFVTVVAGFILLLIAARTDSSGEASATEPVSAVPQIIDDVRPPLELLRHNMQFTGAKYMPHSNDGQGIVIACFQNKPVPHVPLKTFLNGRVTVAFSDESGRAIGEISPVAWMETNVPRIDFEAGVTHCAVLAAFTKAHWVGCRVTSEYMYWGAPSYSFEHAPLPDGVLKATVTLIGSKNESLPPVYLTLTLAPSGGATVEIDSA